MDVSDFNEIIDQIFHSPITIATIDELRQQTSAAIAAFSAADADQNGTLSSGMISFMNSNYNANDLVTYNIR